MCPASMQNNWSKSKRLHKKSQFNPRKTGWNTFMAAVLSLSVEFRYGRREVMSKRSIQ